MVSATLRKASSFKLALAHRTLVLLESTVSCHASAVLDKTTVSVRQFLDLSLPYQPGSINLARSIAVGLCTVLDAVFGQCATPSLGAQVQIMTSVYHSCSVGIDSTVTCWSVIIRLDV